MEDQTMRVPVSEPRPKLDVIKISSHLNISDLVNPRDEFKFTKAVIAPEAEELKEGFKAMLGENWELVSQDKDEPLGYIKGFQNAVAIMNLWIDSMYITAIEE